MKLAFALFHYFPYGGLERDMLAMAKTCAARGHQVSIYTREWKGEKPVGISVVEISTAALTNHGRAKEFAQKLQTRLQQESSLQPTDVVIGFNKMPGLDVYFAADVCFAQKAYAERNWFYRLGARCRSYLALEKAVFSLDSKTEILIISPAQIPPFQHYYQTPAERLHLLPPGIRRDRMMPVDYAERRAALRQQYGLADTDFLMLMVGSDFRRKGVARSIQALAKLPPKLRKRARLWVAGLDNPEKSIGLAKKLGVEDKLVMLGARDDVAQLMWAADLFLHPAHSEAAGAVLLEAMIAGLPVITTDVCGYAYFVSQQNMGVVLDSAAADTILAETIEQVVQTEPEIWRERGRQFSERENIFSMTEYAAQIIESVGAKQKKSTQIIGNID